MIGSKLGPYELLEEIGRGGMATVYRAYQPNVDRFVAVKVIHRSVALDSKSLDRFQREARLVARLEHPHILPVYDYNGLNDPPYIVMRYLPTGTLKDILEREQLPFHEIAMLISQVASALDYAHRQGIIHRDIKPSNIMVDGEGNAFLTDFGIARIVQGAEGLTGTGMAIGTPGYMAPEQGLGVPIDGRADIYALGVMTYEMLAGRVPYSAETPMAIILKHINDPVPEITVANPKLPPAVNLVMQRSMAKAPDDRYATASEFTRALTNALGPSDDTTPYRLQAAAAQTIEELAKARQQQREEFENYRTAQEALNSPSTMPLSTGGTPPPGKQPPSSRAPMATGPEPVIPGRATARPSPVLLGLGALIIVALLLGGGFFIISGKNNADATSTAQQILAFQNQTAVAAVATSTAQQVVLIAGMTSTADNIATAAAAAARATQSAIPTATNTFVPPAHTATPVKGSSPTLAPTTEVVANTAAPTNTIAPTATLTPVPPTATFTPSNTPTPITPTMTPTASLTPTATEVPLGRLPYLNDFESATPLQGWDLDPTVWKVISDSGNAALVGSGGLNKPAVVLANNSPEWAGATSLLMSYSVNLDQAASGARFIFRYSDKGYYALEMITGLITLTRGQGSKGGVDRGSERQLARLPNASIRNGAWYSVQVWSDVTRLSVYVNNHLVLQTEDVGDPLPGGLILFQDFSNTYRVRWDNLKVQRPLPASQHFQGADWPNTWFRTSINSAKIDTDTSGNGYVDVTSGDVRPINPPLTDMLMSCRIQSIQGGFDLRVRESTNGSFLFQFAAGNLTVNQIDNTGKVVQKWPFPNFYGRADFFEVYIETIGDELRMYKNGDAILDEHVPDGPKTGDIRFTANSGDEFHIDDCLFAETSKSITEDASWAFDKIKEVESRPYQTLLTDWVDKFDDQFKTKDWWEGGVDAPGDFKYDKKEQIPYLEMTYKDGAAWRMFRYVKEFYVFGLGQDKTTFFDSSDIYLRVNVRLPNPGTAWIMTRTSVSLGGGTLNGFRIDLTKDASGAYTVKASGYEASGQPVYYQGPLPLQTGEAAPEWVQLLIINYQDRVAFFANTRFLGSARGVDTLSGTIALGVEPNSVADFADCELRDVSPETR